MTLGVTLGLVLLCLLASAFFSSAEIAFLAANRRALLNLMTMAEFLRHEELAGPRSARSA